MKKIIFYVIFIFLFNSILHSERFYYLDNFNPYTNNTELSNNFTMAIGGGGSGTIELQLFPSIEFIDKAVKFTYNIDGGWSLASKQLSRTVDMNYYSNIHFYIKGTTTSTDDVIKLEIKDTNWNKLELKTSKYFKISTNWEYHVFNINNDFTNSTGADLTKIKEFLFSAVSGSGVFYLDEICLGSRSISNYYHFNKNQDYCLDDFNSYSNNITNVWYVDSTTSNVITGLSVDEQGYEGKCFNIEYDTSQFPYYGKVVLNITRSISDWSKFKYIKINYKGKYNDAFRILLEDIYGNWWQSDDIVKQNTYLEWKEKYFDITDSFSYLYEQNIKRFIIVVKGDEYNGKGDFYVDDIKLLKTFETSSYINNASGNKAEEIYNINVKNKILKIGSDELKINYTVNNDSDISIRLYSLDHLLLWRKVFAVNSGSYFIEKNLAEIKNLKTGLYILYIKMYNAFYENEKHILLNINK